MTRRKVNIAMEHPGADDLVPLDQDHPGFRDEHYRERRNFIAQVALNYKSGPVPYIDYTEGEHAVWREVWSHLEPLYHKYGHSELIELNGQLGIERHQIPQLEDLNQNLQKATGFRMEPVAGLIEGPVFLRRMSDDIFLATQYVRHHSVALYTPEPDVIHEVIGHAALLTHPGLADLNRAFGAATHHIRDEAHARELERLYWYSVEYGAVTEGNDVKGWGAGLMAGFGELERFSVEAKLRDWSPETMAKTPYDPTIYNENIFVAPSLDEAFSSIRSYLERTYC